MWKRDNGISRFGVLLLVVVDMLESMDQKRRVSSSPPPQLSKPLRSQRDTKGIRWIARLGTQRVYRIRHRRLVDTRSLFRFGFLPFFIHDW